MRSSEVLVILLLILLNGFFALSEMALVSAKRSRLQAAAEQGRTGAKSALALMEDPTTLLSAIQIGITLIAIFTGLYSGATFAEPLAGTLDRLRRAAPVRRRRRLRASWCWSSPSSRSIVGELVPKRVALLHAETLAMRVAPIMRLFATSWRPRSGCCACR